MTLFNDKEKAEENKYAHDQEVDFIVHARRNRLLGDWVASKIGLDGEEAAAYAQSLKTIGLGSDGDNEIIAKVQKDLLAAEVDISEHDLRSHLYNLGHEARKTVEKDN